MILSRINAFVSHLPVIMVYLVTKKIKEDIMVQNPDILRRFEDDLARKEGRIPYARAMKIFSSLWQEGKVLGIFPGKDPLAGIDVDIRLAKVLNSCSKKSSQH